MKKMISVYNNSKNVGSLEIDVPDNTLNGVFNCTDNDGNKITIYVRETDIGLVVPPEVAKVIIDSWSKVNGVDIIERQGK